MIVCPAHGSVNPCNVSCLVRSHSASATTLCLHLRCCMVQANIARCKFTRPTPIQKHALPIALAGRDLMACAQVRPASRALSARHAVAPRVVAHVGWRKPIRAQLRGRNAPVWCRPARGRRLRTCSRASRPSYKCGTAVARRSAPASPSRRSLSWRRLASSRSRSRRSCGRALLAQAPCCATAAADTNKTRTASVCTHTATASCRKVPKVYARADPRGWAALHLLVGASHSRGVWWRGHDAAAGADRCAGPKQIQRQTVSRHSPLR